MSSTHYPIFSVGLALLLGLGSCAPPPPEPPAPYGPVPTEAQLDWHAMETNAFIHFTTNTFTNLEWGYGDESPEIFNPTDLDVDQWITTLKAAGFQGVILTSKHHDGFTLWPSEYTDHSVEQSPWKNGEGDIVGLVEEACRRHGLKFGVYLSPWDRNRADYGDSTYITYYRNQLTEIFERYGPIFEMWFDGANGGDGHYGGADERRSIDGQHYYDWPTTIEMVRELQPDPQTIIFSDAGPDIRWVGNERGYAGEPNWNTIDPDTLYAGKAGITDLLNHGTRGADTCMPAEVDVSIRPGWFYHPEEDSLVKSPEELFEIYLTSVGRGSVLLLNVPPDRRGRIHEIDSANLLQWRQMIDSTFARNLAEDATAEGDGYRGGHADYAPTQVLDDDPATYWATDDGVTTGALTLTLPEPREVNYVMLQENIRLGQRIAAFRVLARVDGELQEIGTAQTVGYKRILPVDSVVTDQLIIEITDALAPPTLSRVSLF
ncbi:alpha-L-fucosidase [Lewinella marina]|uniref:alpha-L-fucosidase n=1 Tax=Neolewinella marina TaxID=438751 RepID=A0A2G0CJ93_9BACT|nr:alpha-L-fucosidase [Neolewinella marina]NJB84795.1 alpha-L-fucosidase [Neolewinella marina]PHL00047.1 glycoside hydrolase family 29 [Neolewinella marina]